MPVEYLTTATQVFIDLQSGMARPYWEINYTLSATASTTSGTLGQAFDTANDIISVGTIDKEKSVTISGTDKIYAGDITIQLSNREKRYSPLNPDGILYNKDYINAPINVWAGFYNVSGTALVLQQGSFRLDKLRIDSDLLSFILYPIRFLSLS